MTLPREYKPGKTWDVTRETVMGCARLEPKAETNAVLKFLLFHAASKTGVSLHSFEVLPNRSQVLVTDRSDKFPKMSVMADFLRIYHQSVAEHLAELQEIPGPLWSSSGPKMTSIEGPEAALDAIAESLAGAAQADFCAASEDWFGLISRIEHLAGREITIPRPPGVRPSFPESVTVRLEKPPMLEHLSRAEYRRRVRRRLRRRDAEIRTARQLEGRQVVPQSVTESRHVLERVEIPPGAHGEPGQDRPKTCPVSCDSEAEQRAAAQRIRAFRRAYREAYRRWARGRRDVEFPYGTYAIARFHGARVAPAPT